MDASKNKTQVYWPNGQQKEVPNDGYVFAGNTDTYTWDGYLEVWVSGNGGKIVDFTPAGMPSKVIQVSNPNSSNILSDSNTDLAEEFAKLLIDGESYRKPCECGADKVSSPRHSGWCPRSQEANQ